MRAQWQFLGCFVPVEHCLSVLIDGGALNPLPYDLLLDMVDIIILVDVTFEGRTMARRIASPLESMFGAAQVTQETITEQKIRRRPPDILICPRVEQFGVLDFFRAGHILRGSDESKDELKTALHELIKTFRVA